MDAYDGISLELFLEIFWLAVFFWFVYVVLMMFVEIFNLPRLRRMTECDEEYKDRDIFTQLMNYPIEKVESLSDAFIRVMSYIYRYLMRFYEMFSIFLNIRTLYFFHVVSIILTFVAFYYWAQVVYLATLPMFSLEYMLKTKTGDQERELFHLASTLSAKFTMYRKVQGINSIFLVCGIFAYFSFSLKLSVVLHVVRLAKRDLFSYAIFFVIIVFGFGIGGYMIYGDKLENFNSVLRSSLEIVLMTIGGVNYEKMKKAEAFVTPIFVFTYLIVAYIISLKMFIVILDATYKDLI